MVPSAMLLVASLAALVIAGPLPPIKVRSFPILVGRNDTGPPPAGSPVNQGTLDLIESLEGFRSDYYTIDGDQTIGYGHDCTQREDCESINAPITEEEGEEFLISDLPDYTGCVCGLPNAAGLNGNQYGALVSFTYNSGCGNTQDYFTSSMENSDYSGICGALPSTNTLDGELSSRRQREGEFCNQPTTEPSGC